MSSFFLLFFFPPLFGVTGKQGINKSPHLLLQILPGDVFIPIRSPGFFCVLLQKMDLTARICYREQRLIPTAGGAPFLLVILLLRRRYKRGRGGFCGTRVCWATDSYSAQREAPASAGFPANRSVTPDQRWRREWRESRGRGPALDPRWVRVHFSFADRAA